MTEWQPFETAPKDGTWVLAYDGESQWQADVEETYFLVRYSEAYRSWNIALDGQPTMFTHWMPVPPPPSTDRGE